MKVCLTQNSVYPVYEWENGVRVIFPPYGPTKGEPYGILGFLDQIETRVFSIGDEVEFRRRHDNSLIEYDELSSVLNQEPAIGLRIVSMLRQDGKFVRRGKHTFMFSGKITEIRDVNV